MSNFSGAALITTSTLASSDALDVPSGAALITLAAVNAAVLVDADAFAYDGSAGSGLACIVAADQLVFKAGESRRITAKFVDSSGASLQADSGSVKYFLYRQGAAGSGLTLLNSGGTAMTDVSGGSLTDWEATITFASANAHVVIVMGTVGTVVPGEIGMVVFVPPKFHFDPTGLFM